MIRYLSFEIVLHKQSQKPSCSIHLNKGAKEATEQNTKVQEKKNYEMISTPCPPTHTLISINYPSLIPSPHHLSQSSILCNNNTMDIDVEVLKIDEIFILQLGSVAGPCVSMPCLLQDTIHIY